MRIAFIGMPGCGKSTIGARLADIKEYNFIDIDKVIEARNHCSLQEVVDLLGHEAFIQHESAVARDVIRRSPDGTVFAPGGSIIYSPHAMRALRDACDEVIFLRVSLPILEARIGNTPRGITANGKTFAELFEERQPLYVEHATLTINGEPSVDEVVRTVMTRIKRKESA
jgi:shikimate kinase